VLILLAIGAGNDINLRALLQLSTFFLGLNDISTAVV
jgi:hypothetical protein